MKSTQIVKSHYYVVKESSKAIPRIIKVKSKTSKYVCGETLQFPNDYVLCEHVSQEADAQQISKFLTILMDKNKE